MVDEPAKAEAAAKLLRESDAELVFLYISTYALSSTVLPVVQRLGVPVVVLNLQPEPAIDYDRLNAMGDRGRMTGEWLAHCQACSVPEVACVFNRLGLRYDIVTGYLAESSVWERIGGVGRCRPGGIDATVQPHGRARPLLLRHARRVHRLDAPLGRVRHSFRAARNVRAEDIARRGDAAAGRREDRRVLRNVRRGPRLRAFRDRAGGRTSVALDGLVAGTLSDRWPIITRGRAITRTSSRR